MHLFDILNYQPFGDLRIIHLLMIFFLILLAWIECKEWIIEKNGNKFKKRY